MGDDLAAGFRPYKHLFTVFVLPDEILFSGVLVNVWDVRIGLSRRGI